MNDQFQAVNEQITSATEEFMKNAKNLETPKEVKNMMLENLEKSKETFEKISETTKVATKEYEDLVNKTQKSTRKITDKVATNAKKNTDAAIENFKAMLKCNDVSEAMKLQTEFVRDQFEQVSKQNTELLELSKKTAEEIVKASTSYAQGTAEKFKPTA